MQPQFNLDSEMNLLEKYNISPNELFLIRALLLHNEEFTPEYLKRYFAIPETARGSVFDMLHSLQDKGVILKSYKIPKKGEQFHPEDIEFNKAFIKTFYRESFVLGKELFEAYPPFAEIDGCMRSLRTISKKFDSKEDFYRAYGRIIKFNQEKHEKILELLEWAKQNTNFINFGILSFVIDEKWDDIELLKNGNVSNVNFEAIKSL